MIRFDSEAAFARLFGSLPAPDDVSLRLARERQESLTKPAGALGRLEEIATFMAAWQGKAQPALQKVQAVIFAGNHGVAAQGVSAFPPEVTAQMVANFQSGGAAINQLAQACGAELSIVALDLDRPTGDISREAAMTPAECLAALNAGAAAVLPDTQDRKSVV